MSFEHYTPQAAADLLADPGSRDALRLASREFYAVLEQQDFQWSRLSARARHTLQKYHNRACWRPTPFGAFASFSLLNWADGQAVRLGEERLLLLPDRTRSAGRFNGAMTYEDTTLIAPNPTIYRLGGHYRYIRTTAGTGTKLGFTIDAAEAVRFNTILLKEFRDGPLTAGAVRQRIARQADCSEADAADYLRFLIEEQFLFTAGQGSVIGTDDPPLQLGLGRAAALPDVPLYAALERPAVPGGPGMADQAELAGVMAALQRLAYHPERKRLTGFAAAFSARFELQEVPLLTALDPDAGISYGQDIVAASAAEMTRPLPAPASDATWSGPEALRNFFLRRWLSAPRHAPLVLTAADLTALPDNGAVLPPTLAVMFRKAGSGLVLEYAAGASATQLIGRFSAFSAEVHQLCREIAGAEQQANPEVLFADIDMLSDNYTDNVNRRRAIYDHELPVNTFTGPRTSCLAIADLLLSARGGELFLRDRRSGKRVIPRLATAYNHQHTALALFRFLCDLQYQGICSDILPDLRTMFPGQSFYPRLQFGRTVIQPACWKLSAPELSALREAAGSGPDAFRTACDQLGLPRRVRTGSFDQQLVFDLRNEEQVRFLFRCLEQKQEVAFQEYLLPDGLVQGPAGKHAGQFIALLYREDRCYRPVQRTLFRAGKVKRDFPPGSEWLYLKLYVHPASADQVLEAVVGPLISRYQKLIRRWFFIRYTDTGGDHLRLRLLVSGADQAGILATLQRLSQQGPARGLVTTVVSDTYRRELERYGGRYIGHVETLFMAGSELALSTIGTCSPLEAAWVCGLELLERFLPGPAQRLAFVKRMSAHFAQRTDRSVRVRLDTEYRKRSPALISITTPVTAQWEQWRVSVAALAAALAAEPGERRESMLGDVWHMQVNRLFASGQREQEHLLYHFWSKYLTSVQARETQRALSR